MNTFATLRQRATLPTRWLTARAAALTLTCFVSRPQQAYADHVAPPPVPANIQVPAGNEAFLEGHGVGGSEGDAGGRNEMSLKPRDVVEWRRLVTRHHRGLHPGRRTARRDSHERTLQ